MGKLNDLGKEAYTNAVAHGFYDTPPSVPERLCLIHSEISEALEDFRDGKMELEFTESGKPIGFPIELADALVRIVDLACYKGIDSDEVVRVKMAYKEAYPNDVAHGFYDMPPSVPDRLCLIHSEISKAFDDFRDGKMELEFTESGKPVGFPSELAEALISIIDLAFYKGIDLDEAVRVKMAYNVSRPYKHGRKVL